MAAGPNDPFQTHHDQINNRARTFPAASQEMRQPGEDPFMVNRDGRIRVQVSILSARALPQRGSRGVTFAMCSAKNKIAFRTKESRENHDPQFDDPGQIVARWARNDALVFKIYDKDRSGFGLMSQEVLVAQAELPCEKYYPNGLKTWLPLQNPHGMPLQGAALYIQVEVTGAPRQTMYEKVRHWVREDIDWAKTKIKETPGDIIAAWYALLGDPAHDRKQDEMFPLILIPLGSFLLLTWMGWIVQRFNAMAVSFVDAVVLLATFALIVMSLTTHKHSKMPLFAIGTLMIVSAFLGFSASAHGWNECWRQFWWMHTGHSMGATASTPADARNDAAAVTFQTVKDGTAWTSVDATRSAGYRDQDIYCAAPIMDPNVVLGDIMRVEFWAIGINCCDDFGSFTCDNSRNSKASVGVVMKGHGMPCYDCNERKFRLAAEKAAGAFHLVSAPGALYVRYVDSAETVKLEYLARCVGSIFGSIVFGGVVFGFLGYVINYKGWCKPGHFPLYNFLDDKKDARQLLERENEDLGNEKSFTIVLTPGPNNQMNLAALSPEEENTLNYGTY